MSIKLQTFLFGMIAGALVSFALIVMASIAFADTPASLVRVIDGDTVVLESQVWPNVTVSHHFRLYGIDTPETRTKNLCEKAKGLAARAFLASYLANKTISTANEKVGAFGRIRGTLMANGFDVSQVMIKAGYAVPYFGGKHINWCP